MKACYNSLKQLTGYSLVVIDNTNWREYVELPGYIVEKWERARIPAALFSDLLRVELLIKYGGTWIDSTVLCTGGSRIMVQGSKLMDAPLFVFQYTKEGSVPVSISNWFITACRNNEVLMVLRKPEFRQDKDFTVVMWRKEVAGMVQGNPERSKSDPNLVEQVYQLIVQDRSISRARLSELLNVSER